MGGVFERFKNLEYFKNFAVNEELGIITWQDELDVSPESLYSEASGSPLPPGHLPYLLNPGLCYVVLTYPETRPCMPFLFAGSYLRSLVALAYLRSGFLQTKPRGNALAFG